MLNIKFYEWYGDTSSTLIREDINKSAMIDVSCKKGIVNVQVEYC